MSCSDCQQSLFWRKVGRCRQCILLLTVFSLLLSAGLWWLTAQGAGSAALRSVQGIALAMAWLASVGLLLLHLIMRWLIIARQHQRLAKGAKPRSTR
ncbi:MULTISPECIES: DUF3624 family protein [unclassified Vibrio]|uniref:DUF3624 family protein n=1 Tax=Vibrio sp. HB236076 TaxID=3232307 RepID=A0AB39HBV4_9VIBR|nr:DUF3624 family protein [Vibrio sp. HB161653]MDP5255769.1 DUF3624 family protein [Vibrio sp. HB161653]